MFIFSGQVLDWKLDQRIISLLSTFLFLLFVSPALGQVSDARIGVLGAPEEPRFSELVGGLKRGLRELGYSEQAIEIVEERLPKGRSSE